VSFGARQVFVFAGLLVDVLPSFEHLEAAHPHYFETNGRGSGTRKRSSAPSE
jgi:hypothetical protein